MHNYGRRSVRKDKLGLQKQVDIMHNYGRRSVRKDKLGLQKQVDIMHNYGRRSVKDKFGLQIGRCTHRSK